MQATRLPNAGSSAMAYTLPAQPAVLSAAP